MKLRLVIFGASGRTGQVLTQQALERGYKVTAVTRRTEHFHLRHSQLRIVQGDVYDVSSVATAIEGQDAVISVIGVPYTWKKITVYSQSATAIVHAMKVTGVRRLICTSSSGTNPQYDPGEGFLFGYLIKPTIGHSTFVDQRKQEAIVMQSNLDWTIIRPTKLVTPSTVTSYQVKEGYRISGKPYTARMDIADFMFKYLRFNKYWRTAVTIASNL